VALYVVNLFATTHRRIKIMSRNGEFKLFRVLGPVLWLVWASPGIFSQEGPGNSKIVSIEFKGGSIADYAKAVAEAANKLQQGDFNVVIDEEASNVVMPPISLKNVLASTALDLLPVIASSEQHEIYFKHMAAAPSEVYVLNIKARRGPHKAVPEPPEKRLEVFSLPEKYKASPGTILSAIDAVLGMKGLTGEEKAMPIKFHPDSGLLIVHGTPEQIDVVSKVLSQISPASSQPIADMKELQETIKKLQNEVEKLKAQVEDLKKQAAKGGLSN
jgi:hypothetical protein